MCGIVALLSLNDPIDIAHLRAATQALTHRGPDGHTVWHADDGRVGLGHTRLHLIGDGTQPIASSDGRLRIVVNGEFYDHDRVRKELCRSGHRFSTNTDSEIALHLYEEHGTGCVIRLRGEFSLIVWDRGRQRLFAARDRFGIKPLFYAHRRGTLVVASEIKAILAAGVAPIWDNDAVDDAVHGCLLQDRTLFARIHQLPAGHTLVAGPNGLVIERYWDVDYPRASALDPPPDLDTAVKEVRRHLVEAVTLRMQAGVPVGYLLSGGLDSSAMTGIAAAHSRRPVHAFTVSFDSDRYDEQDAARRTADHLGAELTVVRASDQCLAACFVDAVTQAEGLHYNAHGPARYLLSRTIHSHGLRAVMGGEGADEAFAGYGFIANALSPDTAPVGRARRLLRMANLLTPLRGPEKSLALTSPLLARATRIANLPSELRDRAATWLEIQRSILSPDLRNERQRDPYLALARTLPLNQLRGRERARQLLYIWLRTIFVGYHLGADRLDMAHAVETRLPYLDHHLFQHLHAYPITTLAHGGRPKQLLRLAARPYLTDTVYHAPKQPFYAPPLASQPGTAMNELVNDLFHSAAIDDNPHLDTTGCRKLMARLPDVHLRQRASFDPIVMLAASLIALQTRYRPGVP